MSKWRVNGCVKDVNSKGRMALQFHIHSWSTHCAKDWALLFQELEGLWAMHFIPRRGRWRPWRSPYVWFCVCELLRWVTLRNPMDYNSPLGSSVHGILQARILEWVAISFARGSSWPRDWTWVSCITGRFFALWDTGKSIWLASSYVLPERDPGALHF